MHFVIRDRHLQPSSSDFADLEAALAHFKDNDIVVQSPAPSSDEPVVVLSHGINPICAVPPKDVITRVREDFLLFWARDEDREGEEVVVVWDDYDIHSNEDWAWAIVSIDQWAELKDSKGLVRLFNNAQEARDFVHDDGMVLIQFSEKEGWREVVVHKHDIEACDAIVGCVDPRVLEALDVPNGPEIRRSYSDGTVEIGEILNGPVPSSDIPATVVRIVIDDQGGVHVVFETGDEYNGRRFFGRRFSHEEAVRLLKL